MLVQLKFSLFACSDFLYFNFWFSNKKWLYFHTFDHDRILIVFCTQIYYFTSLHEDNAMLHPSMAQKFEFHLQFPRRDVQARFQSTIIKCALWSFSCSFNTFSGRSISTLNLKSHFLTTEQFNKSKTFYNTVPANYSYTLGKIPSLSEVKHFKCFTENNSMWYFFK